MVGHKNRQSNKQNYYHIQNVFIITVTDNLFDLSKPRFTSLNTGHQLFVTTDHQTFTVYLRSNESLISVVDYVGGVVGLKPPMLIT